MNCVGIDVSKGKSMITVIRPFGEVIVSPFEVRHTAKVYSRGGYSAAFKKLLPAVPAVFQGTDYVEEQSDLSAGCSVPRGESFVRQSTTGRWQ